MATTQPSARGHGADAVELVTKHSCTTRARRRTTARPRPGAGACKDAVRSVRADELHDCSAIVSERHHLGEPSDASRQRRGRVGRRRASTRSRARLRARAVRTTAEMRRLPDERAAAAMSQHSDHDARRRPRVVRAGDGASTNETTSAARATESGEYRRRRRSSVRGGGRRGGARSVRWRSRASSRVLRGCRSPSRSSAHSRCRRRIRPSRMREHRVGRSPRRARRG